MPKRRNPFGEITPLQRKTHVGFDQMASQEEIQAVFEKTKDLLFQGAKGVTLAQRHLYPIRENNICRDHHSLNGGGCQLLPSGITNGTKVKVQHRGLLNYFTSSHETRSRKEKLPRQVVEEGGGAIVCIGCRGQQKGVWSCNHCEMMVCEECSRYCCSCEATFCPNCSVLNYDETELRSFCLSCTISC